MEVKIRKEYGNLREYIYDKTPLTKDSFSLTVKEGELLSTTRDSVFKIMFANSENIEFACKIFSSILDVDMDYLYEHIEPDKNELDITLEDLQRRVDVHYRCDNVRLSLEMNNTNKFERNAEYTHKMYRSKMKKKNSKEERKYSDVVQFNINNFVMEGVDKAIDISFSTNGTVRRTRIIYIDIYLPLLLRKYREVGVENMTEGERIILGMFIGNEEEMKKLERNDEIMKRFLVKIKRLMRNKNFMRKYEEESSTVTLGRMQGEEIGHERGLQEGLEQGLERGLEQGLKQGKEETARSMLKDGVPLEKIQLYTNLSKEKIKYISTLL